MVQQTGLDELLGKRALDPIADEDERGLPLLVTGSRASCVSTKTGHVNW